MTDVAVLGAGSGGTMTANLLDRKLKSDVDVTVVDKHATHYYQPSYYLLPFDYMVPEAQSRGVRDLLRPDVEFVEDEVVGVDPEAQTVECAGTELDYDYLVVATGHKLEEEATPGMAEGWADTDEVFPYYNYDAAVDMEEAVEEFDGGTFVVTTPTTPYKCAGAPLKMAMLMEDYMTRAGIREGSEVIMTKPGDAIFGVEPYKTKMEEIWADRDIEFRANFTVESIDPDDRVIQSEEGDSIEYDLLAPVSPQYGQDPIAENSGLTDGGEYVTVDDHTLQHDEYDNVFALGDCENTPKSKTASAARKQSPVIAKNIARHMEGRALAPDYDGYAACPLLTGKGKAVIAEFNYTDPISAPVESRLNWILDINVIPPVYWNLWMRGYDPVP